MRTEKYFLVLDGLMIVIGMITLCIIYPAIAYGYVPIKGLHYKRGKYPNKASKDSSDNKAGLQKSTTPSTSEYTNRVKYPQVLR